MTLDINYKKKKKTAQNANTWRLNDKKKKKRIIEEIKEEIKKDSDK